MGIDLGVVDVFADVAGRRLGVLNDPLGGHRACRGSRFVGATPLIGGVTEIRAHVGIDLAVDRTAMGLTAVVVSRLDALSGRPNRFAARVIGEFALNEVGWSRALNVFIDRREVVRNLVAAGDRQV